MTIYKTIKSAQKVADKLNWKVEMDNYWVYKREFGYIVANKNLIEDKTGQVDARGE
jgi:hypothetical protein